MLSRHLWLLLSALSACTTEGEPAHDEAGEDEVLFAAYSPPPLSPQVPRIPTPADPRLPDIPTQALGFWRGDFSVTPDGASSYRLELDFARGRAGIEPSVQVRYGSDVADGPLGVGWTLAGVSKIHRCPKKYSIDLSSRPVQFLSDDALCLDGARLLEVPTPERTTTRGDIELRLEHDVGIRVLAFTNGVPRTPINDRWDVLRFELAQPSGTLASFGGDAGSTMLGPGGRSRVWAERTRYDLFGNTMTFTWSKPRKDRHPSLGLEEREQVLERIDYTSAPALPASRSIQLIYQTRSRASFGYGRSGAHHDTQQLTELVGSVDGKIERRYVLEYTASPVTARSRLTRIKKCDARSVCLENTFDYESTPARFDRLPSAIPREHEDRVVASLSPRRGAMLADMDGDGRDDLVQLRTGVSERDQRVIVRYSDFGSGAGDFGPESVELEIAIDDLFLVDVDADGRTDVLTNGRWNRSVGRGFEVRATNLPADLDQGNVYAQRSLFADVDGDGIKDLLRCWDDTYQYWSNRGDGTFTRVMSFGQHPCDRGGMPADLFGDGDTEVVYSSEGGPRFDAWFNARLHVGGYDLDSWNALLVDLNGDGLVDRLSSLDEQDQLGILELRPNVASSWAAARTLRSSTIDRPGEPAFFGRGRVVTGDFDNDGVADIAFATYPLLESSLPGRYPHTFTAWPSRDVLSPNEAERFAAPMGQLTIAPVGRYGRFPPTVVTGDIDGNGATDVLIVANPDPGEDSDAMILLQSSSKPDLLRAVREGSAHDTYRVDYSPLSRHPGYQASTCSASWPTRCVRGSARWVVERTHRDMGPSSPALTSVWSYENGKQSGRDRGWVGFEKVTESIPSRGQTIVTTRDLSYDPRYKRYPLAARVATKTTTILGASASVQREQHQGVVVTRGASFVTYDARSVVESFDGVPIVQGRPALGLPTSRSIVTRQNPTIHGHPQTVVTDRGDGSVLTQSLTLTSSLEPWAIDRMRDETITHATRAGTASRYRSQFYNSNHRLEYAVDRAGATRDDPFRLITTIEYDSLGLVARVTETAPGGPARATDIVWRDPEHLVELTQKNALGHETTVSLHPAHGQVVRVVDPNGEVTDHSYDGFGRPAISRAPDGTLQSQAYERSGRSDRAYAIRASASGSPDVVIDFDRLSRSRETLSVNFNGELVERTEGYDDHGRVSGWTEPKLVNQPAATFVRISYDGLDRVQRYERVDVASLSSEAWTTAYSSGLETIAGVLGRARTVTDPNRRSSTTYFDSAGSIERASDALGGVTRYEYGPFGHVRSITRPDGERASFVFDAYGFKRESTESATGRLVHTYTNFGELDSVTDARSVVTRFRYDALSRLVEKRVGASDVWTNQYDCSRLPAAACPAGFNHETGRLVRSQSPDGHGRELTYDAAGRVQSETTLIRGERLTYGTRYDHAGRMAQLTYPAASDGRRFTAHFSYNNGELAAVLDAASGFPFWQRQRVDAAGRTTEVLTGDSVVESRGYDFRGALGAQRAVGPTGTIQDLRYDYDAKGLMIGRRDLLQSAREVFVYDELDRLRVSCFNPGTVPVTAGEPLQRYSQAQPSSSPVSSATLERELRSRDGVTAATRAGFWREQSRSPLTSVAQAEVLLAAGMPLTPTSELAGVQTAYQSCSMLEYDSVGNIRSKTGIGTYEYPGSAGGRALRDGPRRIIAPGGGVVSMTYDASGRLTQKGANTYTYTSDGRLRSATGALGLVTTRYEYGPGGERVLEEGPLGETRSVGSLYRRTKSRSVGGSRVTLSLEATTTSFLIPADGQIVAELRYHDDAPRLSMSGVDTSRQPWSAGGFSSSALSSGAREQLSALPLADSTSAYYFHNDHLGSPNVVTDAYGMVVEQRSYTAFGQLRSPDWLSGRAPPAFGSRLVGYTGHEDDAETGLVNMIGRVYDPALGRFLTPDPVAQAPTYSQSLNRYAYVWNSPLSRVDPTGFQSETKIEFDYGSTITASKGPPAGSVDEGSGPDAEARVKRPEVEAPSDAPGLSLAPGDTIDGIRIDPSAPVVVMVEECRYGTMREYRPGLVESYLEPLFPWLVLFDGDRNIGVNEHQRTRLLEGALADLASAGVPWTKGATGARLLGGGVRGATSALNPPIRITPQGIQHVVERHTHSGIAKFAGKSKFNAIEDVEDLIRAGTQQRMVQQANGRFARTFDVGRHIGLDRVSGQQTSWMTIITEAGGALVTAFPGVP